MADAHYLMVDGTTWQWAEDYFYASATYVVACPPDRRCQVGMGWFVMGEPLGEKLRFQGELEIALIGIGSLHFRVDDGNGPCQIGFARKGARPISWTWGF